MTANIKMINKSNNSIRLLLPDPNGARLSPNNVLRCRPRAQTVREKPNIINRNYMNTDSSLLCLGSCHGEAYAMSDMRSSSTSRQAPLSAGDAGLTVNVMSFDGANCIVPMLVGPGSF